MDDDGTEPVYERRLPRFRLNIFLYLETFFMASQHRHRGTPVGSTLLLRHGLAVRGRDNPHPHQTGTADNKKNTGTLLHRICRLFDEVERIREGNTHAPGRDKAFIRNPENTPQLPARPAIHADREQGGGI